MNSDWLDALEKPLAKVKVGRSRKGAPCERTVQRAILKAAAQLGIWCVAVPNGTAMVGSDFARVKQASVLRADGVKKGALDLICMASGGRVGWLEVKREGGTLSVEQAVFMARLDRLGIPCAAVCTPDAAIKAWKDWGWA